MFTWRRLEERDFPLVRDWLSEPHVARRWNHETTPEAVARDFGPTLRREEPNEDLLVFLDERPLGLVQRCRLHDDPEYLTDMERIAAVPDGAMTIDYLIGDPRQTGRGIGTATIRWVVERTWVDHPDASCVIVPVVAANRTSRRTLERVGLRRVGEGEIEPDNPIDDPTHYLYRIDRIDRREAPQSSPPLSHENR